MRLRRPTAAALGLLAVLPVLAACGEDVSRYGDGDIVPARQDDQFSDGTASVVALPMGRLEIFLGEPTQDLAADATRSLEAREAPEGSTFVPITWQYDAGTFADYADYVDVSETPRIDLVADQASYRLPPPDETGEGAESFYVLVAGQAEDLQLEVGLSGVVQTVALRTGEREEGAAAAIYDLKPRSTKTRDCTSDAKVRHEEGLADYECKVTSPVELPYADGRWAQEGRTFVGVTLETHLQRFDLRSPLPSAGAIYLPGSVTSTFKLNGERPVATKEEVTDTCPDYTGGGCTARYHVVFDVPADAKRKFTADQTFGLVLGGRWGNFPAEDSLDLDVDLAFALKPVKAAKAGQAAKGR